MKYSDLEAKSLKDLIAQKLKVAEQIQELNMKNSLGQLANPIQIRFLRKDLARLNTAISIKGVR